MFICQFKLSILSIPFQRKKKHTNVYQLYRLLTVGHTRLRVSIITRLLGLIKYDNRTSMPFMSITACSLTVLCWTLTATLRPSCVVATWTWAKDAAPTGSAENEVNSSSGWEKDQIDIYNKQAMDIEDLKLLTKRYKCHNVFLFQKVWEIWQRKLLCNEHVLSFCKNRLSLKGKNHS
jgi:hypothetical protein